MSPFSKAFDERRKTVVAAVADPIFRMMMKITVEGAENIPATGPAILAANHFSWWEPPAMIYASPRPVWFIGADDVTWELRIRWIVKLYGIIPVDRRRMDKRTFDQAFQQLKQGRLVAIFPEGNMQAQELRPPKLGVMFLANRAAVPIIPIGISGQVNPGAFWKKLQRPRVHVKIGKAFMLPSLPDDWQEQKKAMAESGHILMQHIAELIEPERRGFYR
jgi:1-acyl-sn-glycerol-3-phosphate acyltransferase